MKFYEINGTKCIKTDHDRWGAKCERTWKVFEEKIPSDYVMWNIGTNFQYLEEGWLPLAKLKKGEKYSIDPDTLATVYVGRDTTPFLDHIAVRYGLNSLKEAKKALKRYKKDYKQRIAFQAVQVWSTIQKEA